MKHPLSLPERSSKPRTSGRTQTLDKGIPTGLLGPMLEMSGQLVDLVKLGWGTSMVTPDVAGKVGRYRAHGIDVCFGGTLFELFHLQGRLDEYAALMREAGVTAVEVSNGAVAMDEAEKLRAIERFAGEFTVYSEVGSKDADAIVTPAKWVAAINAELDAGVSHVILEGRESGTAGMYRPSGEIRMGLIDEIIDAGVPVERLVFEAPQKAQQVWLIRHIGPEVNLGNIPLEEVIAVETLRLGLRADTLLQIHGPDAR